MKRRPASHSAPAPRRAGVAMHEPAAAAPSLPAPLVTGLLAAALLLLVLVVQRHVLSTYFVLDDAIAFEQARGLRPWPLGAWRFLSGVAWFHAVFPLWGVRPLPYHLASVALHALNVTLLWRLAQRWGASAPAAWLAAGLFAASRLHFTALAAATSAGELLALAGTLGALLLATSPRRGSLVWAVITFAAALLCKETVALVPMAALAAPAPAGARGTRARAAWVLLGVGALAGAVLLGRGVLSGRLGGQAYALGSPAESLANVARLLGWSFDLVSPIPDLRSTLDAAAARPWLVVAVVLAVAGVAWRAAPLVGAGLAWWALAVLPVAPLSGHAYLHYLVVPIAGLALALAGAFDGAWALRDAGWRRARAAWAVVVTLVLLHAAWSDVLQSLRMDLRARTTLAPLDPVRRKGEMLRAAVDDVRGAIGAAPSHVLVLQLASVSTAVDLATGTAARSAQRWETQAVLDDGRALRAFLPSVDSVEFAHVYVHGHAGWDWFMPLGMRLVPLGRPPVAHERAMATLLRNGWAAPAVAYGREALAEWPLDRGLRYAAGLALARTGDAEQARAQWRAVVAGGAADSLGLAAAGALAGAPVEAGEAAPR